MSLIIRVDDFPGTKPNEFDVHNLDNFKKFDKLFKDRGMNYILGVIPGYTSQLSLEWLAEQDNITVALHGVVHNESQQDEFEGLDYVTVRSALLFAKNKLDYILGYSVKDYIPPHNAISSNTIHALEDLKFERIYGGPGTSYESAVQIQESPLDYIHSEPPECYGRSDELMEIDAHEFILKWAACTDICLTLHWPWEMNIGLHNLEKFLDQIIETI